MGEFADIAVCTVILAVAVVIAWPLWAIDESLAAASGRMDRARVRIRVKRYAERMDVQASAVLEAIGAMTRAAEFQGLIISDLEAFYAVRGAVALSRAHAIPLHDAIEAMAKNL